MSHRLRTRTVALAAAILLPGASRAGADVIFGAASAVNSDAAADTQQDSAVRIATDGAGHWVAVWESNKLPVSYNSSEDDLFVSRSSDNGATWTPIAPLDAYAGSDYGSDHEPAITTDRAGTWLVVWRSSYVGGINNDRDIVAARSTDNGATWTPPVAVNPDASTHAFVDEQPAVGSDRHGTWIAAWQRYGSSNLIDVVAARSTDAGTTWSAPVVLSTLSTSPSYDSRMDLQVKVAGDGAGHWVAVWASADALNGPLGQDGDILTSRSADDGVTWSPATALNTDAAVDDADDGGAQVVTNGAGLWLTLWNMWAGGPLAIARSVDQGATWTAPEIIYSGYAYFARFTTDRAGSWIAAWHENDGQGTSDIFTSFSLDDGVTWAPATQLNQSPDSQSVFDAQPDLASDEAGHWVAVWMSHEQFGGTGVDYDILAARTDGGCSEAPRGGCQLIAPGASKIQVLDRSVDTGDLLRWKASLVQASGVTGRYSVCLYDGSGTAVFRASVAGGGMCSRAPCWKQVGATATYRNRARTPYGIESMSVTGGALPKMSIKGRGVYLSNRAYGLPAPPLGLPLLLQVQADGECWAATYSSAGTTGNASGQFRARND